ncbi:MAG: serine protein kinase RIO [Gammaproteobacteria bacterium]|nr:serine protein kinase RIO [Gammaproteobacteria bacterium]
MKIPDSLRPLIEDGVIDEVLHSLRSGKEALVYLVRCGSELRCAKVYKDLRQRSFQQRSQYQEGRRVRSSRQARAMGRSTRFGRKSQETAWKSAEVDALHHLAAAGVRVPAVFDFSNGVLLMELVTDADGDIAPDLGEIEHSPQQALDFHRFLIQQVVRMLCAGLVHGDLSEYNVLIGATGPVIIDLPQVVSATGNNNARAMLLRDVHNITVALGRAAPELLTTRFGEEMWARFERGELEPDSVLTGAFVSEEHAADVAGTLLAIDDAREVARLRQAGRDADNMP